MRCMEFSRALGFSKSFRTISKRVPDTLCALVGSNKKPANQRALVDRLIE